ncbi:MAG: hypothetical protein JKY84_06490 [Emcibacteraceae bacterium]|nr:hypothetical protein [Emcibacteraceae bacterium]
MKQKCLILMALLLSGCITGNYQSFSSGVGYKSEQQGDNIYYVTYTGSSNTDIKKANDFALLRSAELTLEKGFNYFVITEARNNKFELGKARKSLAVLSDNGRVGGNTAVASRGTISGPKAKSELTISLFQDEPDSISYDARVIEKALKEEYEISEQPI